MALGLQIDRDPFFQIPLHIFLVSVPSSCEETMSSIQKGHVTGDVQLEVFFTQRLPQTIVVIFESHKVLHIILQWKSPTTKCK